MIMKKNIGKIDKAARVILSLVFIYLGYMYSAWLYIIAAILILTAALGWCGIYRILGIKTCKVR